MVVGKGDRRKETQCLSGVRLSSPHVPYTARVAQMRQELAEENGIDGSISSHRKVRRVKRTSEDGTERS